MILEHGLETCDYGTQGWNNIYSTNFEKLDSKVGSPLTANNGLGSTLVNDPNNLTAEDLQDNTNGTVSLQLEDCNNGSTNDIINNNFASVCDQINKINDDINSLHNTMLTLLSALRKSTGNGVLDG